MIKNLFRRKTSQLDGEVQLKILMQQHGVLSDQLIFERDEKKIIAILSEIDSLNKKKLSLSRKGGKR